MKTFLFLFLLLNLSNDLDVIEIRELYPNAATSETLSNQLSIKLTNITANSKKTLLAYKGAAIALKSKFSKKLGEKIAEFKEGVKLVEEAVSSEPNNTEIRLIRFSLQENVPDIVNYKKNLKDDKAFLLKHYPELKSPLKEYVRNYMLKSKTLTPAEKLTFK